MMFNKRSPRWIDWSAWNREVEAGKYVDANLYDVLKRNPDIEGVTLRLCDNHGFKDIRFNNYYEQVQRANRDFRRRKIFVDAYAWPNADDWSAREAVEIWLKMLDGRKLDFMWCDHERTYNLHPVTYARSAAALFEVGHEMMGIPQGVYTGVSWWHQNVDHNEFLAQLSGKHPVRYWVAEYPWPYEKYQETKHWDQIPAWMYKSRPSTLSGGEVVRWQFSSQGVLDGYSYNSDLNLQQPWFSGEVYRKRPWWYTKLRRKLQG